MIQLTDQEYKILLHAQEKLNALEMGGVENWDGYDFALEEIRKKAEHNDKINEICSEIQDILSNGLYEPAGRGCGFGFTEKSSDELFEYIKTIFPFGKR